MPVTPSADWEPSVVGQFTRNGELWGVPQLTDAGIALYYNADLLTDAGVDAENLGRARWDPDPAKDTLRPILARLTVDSGGNPAGSPGFDPAGFVNSATTPPTICRASTSTTSARPGGVFADGDRFAFDNPQAAEGLQYVVGLINADHVAPPASDTNDNGDFSCNHSWPGGWLCSSRYLQPGADRRASTVPLGCGDAADRPGRTGQRHQRHCRSGQSGHPTSRGSPLGAGMAGKPGRQRVPGRRGAAIPAVRPAQRSYFDYWSDRKVDVAPFSPCWTAPDPGPGGAGFAAGYQAIKPLFDEMFLGRSPVGATLAAASGRRTPPLSAERQPCGVSTQPTNLRCDGNGTRHRDDRQHDPIITPGP